MKIIFASHTHMQGSFVVGSHHLARALASCGHDVLHIATPVSPFRLLRLADEEVRNWFSAWRWGSIQVESGLQEFLPFTLVPCTISGRLRVRTNLSLATLVPPLRTFLHKAGFEQADMLLIDQPLFWGVWDYLDVRHIIYRPTDIYPMLVGNDSLAELERRVIRRANAVVSTSAPVQQHVASLTEQPIPMTVIPNGVDYEHFAASASSPDEYRSIPEPRAVYVGALDERFDWAAVQAAAIRCPDVHFVLVGPPEAGKKPLGDLPNVYFLGSRPYADVPGYLQHAQVGLLPLSGHPANEGRSPMKLYEYMAAGLDVVARATSELKRRDNPFIHLYATPSEFVKRLSDCLAHSSDNERRIQCREHAKRQSWKRKSSDLMRFVDSLG